MISNSSISRFYLSKILIKNLKCFKGINVINLFDKSSFYSKWTIILGNNNTGKSTLLKLISKADTLSDSFFMGSGLHEEDFIEILADYEISACYIEAVKTSNLTERKIIKNLIAGKDVPYDDYNVGGHHEPSQILNKQYIDAYGTHRVLSKSTLTDYSKVEETTRSLFYDDVELTNAEEWLLQLDYARERRVKGASKRLEQVKILITSKIFPDITSLKFKTGKDFKSTVLFETTYGFVPLSGLSYGYQSTITWIVDLAKRLFDRFPTLNNPLEGPAIVIVDEIDLHLHPEWQRRIVKYLSDIFPNTQFIVTAHSPLVVQSAEIINLVILEKNESTGGVDIRQQFGSFQGWTVEEILRELMDMGEKTRSDKYLELMRLFEDALLSEKYADAKSAYDELDKILSPTSHQRKVLSIQLSSITPVHS